MIIHILAAFAFTYSLFGFVLLCKDRTDMRAPDYTPLGFILWFIATIVWVTFLLNHFRI